MFLFISGNGLAICLAVLSLVGNIIQGVISSSKEKTIASKNADRDIRIAEIEADSDDMRKEIVDLKSQLAKSQSDCDKVSSENLLLRNRVTKLEATISTLTAELERKEQVIIKLKNIKT